jgi:ribA/ribD-fused uncharacterized protein
MAPNKKSKKAGTSKANSPSKEPSVPENELPIFFWRGNEVPHGIFSQWYEGDFNIESSTLGYLSRETNAAAMAEIPSGTMTFNCAEQYMMYCKSIFFNDVYSAQATLETNDPRLQKSIGRSIQGFVEREWVSIRQQVVEEGNLAKFMHDETWKRVLLDTGDRELCEASPYDKIWGIGVEAEAAKKMVPNAVHKWGKNLLGKGLMNVRERIRESEKEEREQITEEDEGLVV